MIDVETKLWRAKEIGHGQLLVTQKASGVSRTVSRGKLPSVEAVAAMHERRFDRLCREAFHGE